MLLDLFNVAFITSLLAGAIRITTPIIFGSLGELVTERTGILNLSIEGHMLMGALAGFLVAFKTGSLWMGMGSALLAGALLSLLFSFMAITLKIDQVVTGLTINILSAGLSFFFYRLAFPGIGSGDLPNVEIFAKLPIPLLADIPILGDALFNHNILVYTAYLCVPLIAIFLNRSKYGLILRCIGENPRAVDMKGINVTAYQYKAVMFGGMMSGAGGAFLSLAATGMWLPDITSGRGWIAFAIVIFGNWRPRNIMLAALFFGFLDSLQLQIQGIGIQFPYQILLALPYVLTIFALLWKKRRSLEPMALGVPYSRE